MDVSSDEELSPTPRAADPPEAPDADDAATSPVRSSASPTRSSATAPAAALSPGNAGETSGRSPSSWSAAAMGAMRSSAMGVSPSSNSAASRPSQFSANSRKSSRASRAGNFRDRVMKFANRKQGRSGAPAEALVTSAVDTGDFGDLISHLRNAMKAPAEVAAATAGQELLAEVEEEFEDSHKREARAFAQEQAETDAWLTMLFGDETLTFLEREAKQSKEVAAAAWFDLFFGFFIILNGIFIMLATDGHFGERQPTAIVVQSLFCTIFSVEYVMRLRTGMRLKPWRKVVLEPAMIIDLFMVIFGFVDIFIGQLVMAGASRFLPAVRIFRLLKVVRILRLLKLFKELWLIVIGMVKSLETLFWLITALLIVTTFFAMLISTLIEAPDDGDPELYLHWGTVSRILFTLIQITTYDDWASVVRRLVFGPPENPAASQPYLLFVLVPFVAITSHAIMHLVVGVMLTSSLQVTHHDRNYHTNVLILRQRQALMALRREMRRRSLWERPDGYVTGSMLKRWLVEKQSEEPPAGAVEKLISESLTNSSRAEALAAALDEAEANEAKKFTFKNNVSFSMLNAGVRRALEATSKRSSSSCSVGEEEEEVKKEDEPPSRIARRLHIAGITAEDVDVVFAELDATMGAGAEQEHPITAAGFLMGCMWLKSQVQPLDILHILSGLQSVTTRLENTHHCVTGAFHQIHRSLRHLKPLMVKLHESKTRKKFDHEETMEEVPTSYVAHGVDHHEHARTEHMVRSSAVGQNEQEFILKQKRQHERDMAWTRFDSFFGVILVFSGIFLGAQASYYPGGASMYSAGQTSSNSSSPVVDQEKSMAMALTSSNSDEVTFMALGLFFYVMFFVELNLRIVMHYQLEEDWDCRMVYRFFPALAFDLEWEKFKLIVRSVPRLLCKDQLLILDVLIVAGTTLDLLGTGINVFSVSILKLVRMFRLLRFLRVLYLFRPLWYLTVGFASCFELLCWALLTLLSITYLSAIVMVSLAEGGSEDSPWRSLDGSMLRLLRIATYDNWVPLLRDAEQLFTGAGVFLVVYMTITSLGLVNLAIGIMVDTAFSLVNSDREHIQSEQIDLASKELAEAEERAHKEVHKDPRHRHHHHHHHHHGHYEDDGSHHHHHHDGQHAGADAPTSPMRSDSAVAGLGGSMTSEPDPFEASTTDSSDEDYIDEEEEVAGAAATARFERTLTSFGAAGRSAPPHEAREGMIGILEMEKLATDPQLWNVLRPLQIRVDHLSAVFTKLDIYGQQRVPSTALADGLLRLREQFEGIDVSAAKSWARRIFGATQSLTKESCDFRECLERMTQAANGAKQEAEEDDDAMTNQLKYLRLKATNAQLSQRAEKLKALVANRRRMLREMGPAWKGADGEGGKPGESGVREVRFVS
eukprot:TRINITY_DN3299_c0_g1_i1.p1 TRINITY_DN3299_c0_g1~~TRINITY_DN3299_c0_g1_i1.p1  ORF type:complete len:1386 (+),score=298.14 TRINITY_DN3299_c0_g1_i1:317-4474(+)